MLSAGDQLEKYKVSEGDEHLISFLSTRKQNEL